MIPSTWYAPHFLLPPSPLSATGGALGARLLTQKNQNAMLTAQHSTQLRVPIQRERGW